MELININKKIIKHYFDKDEIFLECKLLPYQNNSKIKVYYEDEPIGDIPDDYISDFLNKSTSYFYIDKSFDDATGLFELTVTFYDYTLKKEEPKQEQKEKTSENDNDILKNKKQDIKFWLFAISVFLVFVLILYLA